jgi:hypothetical protein
MEVDMEKQTQKLDWIRHRTLVYTSPSIPAETLSEPVATPLPQPQVEQPIPVGTTKITRRLERILNWDYSLSLKKFPKLIAIMPWKQKMAQFHGVQLNSDKTVSLLPHEHCANQLIDDRGTIDEGAHHGSNQNLSHPNVVDYRKFNQK